MSLVQLNEQLSSYMAAELEENVLLNGEVGIVRYDTNPNFSMGNTYTYRQLVEDRTTWQSPTASTDAIFSRFTADSGVAVIQRKGHFVVLGDAEALQMGAASVIENTGTLFARNFIYNVETHLFTNVLGGAFNATNGSLTGTHLVNKSSSAFNWDYVMEAAYLTGQPSDFKYVYMHPDVAKSYKLWDYLDTADVTRTSPVRPMASAKYAGMKDGMHIFLSDLVGSSNNVYNTYVFGDNALYIDFQKRFGTKIWIDDEFEGGATKAKYFVAHACGVNGLTYSGATPSTLAGATDATIATGASWTKMTNIRSNQIKIAKVASLV